MSLDEIERLAKKAASTEWAPLRYSYMQQLTPERILALVACVRAADEAQDYDDITAKKKYRAARTALDKL